MTSRRNTRHHGSCGGVNPRPINVAKSQVTQEGGKTSLLVELRDGNYPGNYYTLTYDQCASLPSQQVAAIEAPHPR